MARYIDADKIHEFVDIKVAEGNGGWANGVPYEWAYALTVIDMQPTADVAPRAEVAREIFEEIEQQCNINGHFEYWRFLELKNKYTEDKNE